MKKKIKIILSFVIFFSGFLMCQSAQAADNYYIRPNIASDASLGCQYNGDGTSWACAASASATGAFNNFPSGENFVRGDTYYISSGTWGNPSTYVFNKTDSGTTWIYIKKATASAHGSDTGWNSALGTGQAVFIDWQTPDVRTDYWDWDGVTGSGSDSTTYGISLSRSLASCVANTSYDLFGIPYFYGNYNSNNVRVQHFAFDGCDLNAYTTACTNELFTRPSGLLPDTQDTGIYIAHNYFGKHNQNAVYPLKTTGTIMEYNYFAGNQSSGLTTIKTVSLNNGGINYQLNDILSIVGGGAGASGGQVLVTGVSNGVITSIALYNGGMNYTAITGLSTTGGHGTNATIDITALAGTANCHGENINLRSTQDTIIRNNFFTDWLIAGIGFHDPMEGSLTNDDTLIYNNVFDGTLSSFYGVERPIGDVSSVADLGKRTKIYQNTFINMNNVDGITNAYSMSDSSYYWNVQNNLFYNSTYATFGSGVTSDYNAYLKVGTHPTETHWNSPNLLVDANASNPLNADYTISKTADDTNVAHVINTGNPNLGSAYAYDAAGVARDATPDIGAYEYVSGTTDTTPPAAPSGLSVN